MAYGAVDLDLGSLSLASRTAGLHLHLSSTARIAQSGTDTDCDLQTLGASLTTNSTARPWVARAHNFSLSIEIDFASCDEFDLVADRLDQLNETIRNSELWQKLWLSPSKVEVRIKEHAVGIVVGLDHTSSNSQTTRRIPHKLGEGVPYYDLKPPAGVRTVMLQSNSLVMHVTDVAPRKRPRLNGLVGKPGTICNPRFDDPGFGGCAAISMPSPLDRSSMLLETRNDYTSLSSTNGITDRNDSQPQKRSSCTDASERLNLRPATPEDLFELLDTAVRCAILSPAKHDVRNAQILGCEAMKRLSDVFPTVWLPQYMFAMSRRALFLPTISHSLASTHKAVQESRLRSKIDELLRRVEVSDRQPKLETCRSAIMMKLWGMANNTTWTTRTPTQLPPLFGTLNTTDGNNNAQPDLVNPGDEPHSLEYGSDECYDLFPAGKEIGGAFGVIEHSEEDTEEQEEDLLAIGIVDYSRQCSRHATVRQSSFGSQASDSGIARHHVPRSISTELLMVDSDAEDMLLL